MNALLIRKFIWKRIIGNLLFTFPFSFLIQLFTQVIGRSDINSFPLVIRVIIDIFGILCVGIGNIALSKGKLGITSK